ncbi:hypothetical protein ACI65C_005087 [Semiaphis heraclei]
MNGLISHLKSVHNVDIESTFLNFENIEDFNCWKKDIEEKELCQYVKSTSSNTNEDKKYIYYYCHRSFAPRIMNKGYKSSKSGGSVKTGHVCPSNIKVHIDHQNIKVNFCSTHLWHTHDIGKQRLFVEDRSMIAETVDSLQRDENQILPPTQQLNVDNAFQQTIIETDLNTKTKEIKNKLEIIYGMVNRAELQKTEQQNTLLINVIK